MLLYQKSPSSLLNTAGRLIIKSFNQLIQQHGVSYGYWPFLLHLYEEDGQTQSMLCKKVGIEQPTAVRILDRMERDALIERKKDVQDRRKFLFYLTERAKSLQNQLYQDATQINTLATQGMSEQEKAQLNRLLLQIIQNFTTQDDCHTKRRTTN